MSRTESEIYNQIVATKEAEPALNIWNNTSQNSVWKLWAGIVAFAIWSLENIFDIHLDECKQIIEDTRPGYIKWYIQKAKEFQFGFDLVNDEIYYDNTGIDADQIENSKIVKYAAAIGVLKGMRLKVAGEMDGELTPIAEDQLNALKAYMFRIAAPGTRIYYVNSPADSLKLKIQIYYNALVLGGTGARLDGSDPMPVQNAINTFLRNQPFNGLFVIANLVDYLQAVPGVVIPHIVEAKAKYGLLAYILILVSYLPDAGYLRLIDPADLELEFIPQEPYK